MFQRLLLQIKQKQILQIGTFLINILIMNETTNIIVFSLLDMLNVCLR